MSASKFKLKDKEKLHTNFSVPTSHKSEYELFLSAPSAYK